MASITAPTPACPAWCTHHTTTAGWDVIHTSSPCRLAEDPGFEGSVELGLRRGDELIPGMPAPESGTPFVTVKFPGQDHVEWFTRAQALDVAYQLILLAAQAGEGVTA